MRSEFEKLKALYVSLEQNFLTALNRMGTLQDDKEGLQKQLIDQGQRFNDQAQRVKDLEYWNAELQKRINNSQDIIESILARSLDNPEIQELCCDLIDVLEGEK